MIEFCMENLEVYFLSNFSRRKWEFEVLKIRILPRHMAIVVQKWHATDDRTLLQCRISTSPCIYSKICPSRPQFDGRLSFMSNFHNNFAIIVQYMLISSLWSDNLPFTVYFPSDFSGRNSENLNTRPLVRKQVDFLADKLIFQQLAQMGKW